MFERNRIDNVDQAGIAVEITTEEGDRSSGKLLIAQGRTLAEVLNSPAAFLEFEPWGGERAFVAKSSLRAIRLVNAPRHESLGQRLSATAEFDPHAILGVPASATHDEVKAAWHRLSKLYHPDRYASADLPSEVVEYLSVMARRVNAAYAALETTLAPVRRLAAARSEPIYTSRPRA
jgi:hypothetical protein